MKNSTKIILLWLASQTAIGAAFYFLPHQEMMGSAIVDSALQALLFFICLFIYRKEPNKKNRFVFLNFVAFFALSFLGTAYYFVGPLTNIKYASFYYFEYHIALYIFALSFAIVYLVIDLLLHNVHTALKYSLTSGIVLVFFVWHFLPFFTNPLYLFSTEDIRQWKVLDEYTASHKDVTNSEEIAGQVNLKSWKDGKPIGDLYPEENVRRIEELQPYIDGDNYTVLLYKPLYMNVIYMSVMMIFFMMLFFGYQYEKDPPQGAYIDKIMFTFLLFASTEILHFWGYIKSIEWGLFLGLFDVGQYITVGVLALMVLFFSLRLRFITSTVGEYYEGELAANPHLVSRWYDLVDEFVLRKIFNMKLVYRLKTVAVQLHVAGPEQHSS
jgi:hypothetical protein